MVCRSFEPTESHKSNPLVNDAQRRDNQDSSPQKRRDNQDSSPSKRTRNMTSFHTLNPSANSTRQPRRKLFINRDFHLEAVLEKSNSSKPFPKSNEEPTPNGQENSESTSITPTETNSNEEKQSKKKKKHKKEIFSEEDFDYPGSRRLFFYSHTSLFFRIFWCFSRSTDQFALCNKGS